ncbi:SRPBCC family protein [Pedobacter gandavensis]|uniref:SRPBCC domain-containing protein n=1 Tax=Pedobacter gandavensis TaxID=2679963 RepID=A0ABR6EVM6_9SPHI|nr:SRPBCC domain-containing protein [Pedobacter gandavensis]MBB2149325.1 SRPBCC domain-containing protein [Pedobacter gandavensis]
MEITKSKEKELYITHLFNAPVEMVFRAWTDPNQLVQWYAPDGCSISYKSINIEKNGSFHSCIHDPVHGDCWVKGKYLDIVFPEKLVFSMNLSNEAGDILAATDAGKPGDWPMEILTTVTFSPIGTQTKLSLHQSVPEASAKENGAYQSWIKMLAKLSSLLGA